MAIVVNGLKKQYKSGKVALNGISFTVEDGEIFGFLGPNGAGKSTTMKILTTILKPTEGTILVDGEDLQQNPIQQRSKFGYIAQDNSLDENLTGRENLLLQSRLYHIKDVAPRMEKIIDLIDLKDDIDELVSQYSGGMKKRLEIGCALLSEPKILFLDEPTLGLDVEVRRDIWKYIKKLSDDFNTTVFITTHYLEEADAICDRISIISDGNIAAIGAPSELKEKVGKEILQVIVDQQEELPKAKDLIEALNYVENITQVDNTLMLMVDNADSRMIETYECLRDKAIKVSGIESKKVNLDDVYLYYTGEKYKDEQ